MRTSIFAYQTRTISSSPSGSSGGPWRRQRREGGGGGAHRAVGGKLAQFPGGPLPNQNLIKLG
jgi:hypothetical protein